MDVLRWIVGGVTGLLAAGWLIFLILGLARDDKRQQRASTRLRQWAQLVFMAWMNVEIWGRVVYTIVTWPR